MTTTEIREELRKEIVLAALRWANNMVVEVLSNHGRILPDEARDKIMEINSANEQAQSIIRRSR